MMTRKHKLRIIQISLLIIGVFIIYYTYYNKDIAQEQKIISKQLEDKIKEKIANQPEGYEVFTNIEYSGLDFSGNRYILKSKKAYNQPDNQEIVNLKQVEAFFYFKDNTILTVLSEEGIYNNKTLDIDFFNNIKAVYEGSVLYAQKAEFSNVNSNLKISDNVKLNDKRGTMFADELFFDIKNQTLNVKSLEKNKINANINIK